MGTAGLGGLGPARSPEKNATNKDVLYRRRMIELLSEDARALLDSAKVATLVTINADGSAHISTAWVGIENGEIVLGTLPDQRKLANIRRDPRVALSVISPKINDWGLQEYIVLEGTARITEGGAAQLLQRLAHVYLGPDVVFPQMPDPPPGFVTHVRVERVRGIGNWLRTKSR